MNRGVARISTTVLVPSPLVSVSRSSKCLINQVPSQIRSVRSFAYPPYLLLNSGNVNAMRLCSRPPCNSSFFLPFSPTYTKFPLCRKIFPLRCVPLSNLPTSVRRFTNQTAQPTSLSSSTGKPKKFSIPSEGILLYEINKARDYRIMAAVAIINVVVFAVYGSLQLSNYVEFGEVQGSSTMVSVVLLIGLTSAILIPVMNRLSSSRAVRRLWALPASTTTTTTPTSNKMSSALQASSSNISNAIRVECHSMFGGAGPVKDFLIKDLLPLKKVASHQTAIRFRPHNEYFYYILYRNGKFIHPEAIEKLLNGKEVTFKG